MHSASSWKKTSALVALVLAAALVIAGCASASQNGTFDASNVACSQVATQLNKAQSDLANAESKLSADKGKPSVKDDQKAVDKAQAKVDALKARQDSAQCQTGSASASPSSTPTSPAPSSTSASPPVVTIDQALLTSLTSAGTVPACSVYVPASQVSDGGARAKLGYKALASAGKRYASDSPSTPIAGATTKANFADVLAKNCQDPNQGYQAGNLLYHLKLGNTGKTVGSLNPFLVKAHADASTSAQMLKTAFPYAGTDLKTASPAVQRKAAAAWNAYEVYASRVNDLLMRNFKIVGVSKNPQSKENYVLLDEGMVSGIPAVGLAKTQENLSAFVYVLTTKGQPCEIARVGNNMHDTRYEVFAPQGCTTPPHSTPTTPKSTPSTPHHVTPSTHPRTTPTPTPTPSHSKPPKTCYSVYGPGYGGTYPHCHKTTVGSGGSSVIPPPPPSAPGTNPAPNPTNNPGSNQCYSETTGLPVQPVNGKCPPGSFGG
jgi:hypothetical protein